MRSFGAGRQAWPPVPFTAAADFRHWMAGFGVCGCLRRARIGSNGTGWRASMCVGRGNPRYLAGFRDLRSSRLRRRLRTFCLRSRPNLERSPLRRDKRLSSVIARCWVGGQCCSPPPTDEDDGRGLRGWCSAPWCSVVVFTPPSVSPGNASAASTDAWPRRDLESVSLSTPHSAGRLARGGRGTAC